jgi:ssRNA-specific RNase YbeY (16S rRNA maturation enzyme)
MDGREPSLAGVPHQLGDVVICPEIVGSEWRGPLVHGLLHLLGYEHGAEMSARERSLA